MSKVTIRNRTDVAKGGLLRRLAGRGIFLYPIIVVLIVWECVARFGGFPPTMLPPFSVVAEQFVSLLISGELIAVTAVTLQRAALGLVIAILVGVPVGLAMSRSKLAKWFFEPLVSFGFSTPTITLLPVFILWFGTGYLSEVLLVALSCFFTIALSTYDGAKNVSTVIVWSAQAMGTRERDLPHRIVLPAAITFIFAGIRVALPLAVIIAVLAEMIGGGGGLGYMLMYGYRFLDAPSAFAALLAILLLGLLIDQALLWSRRIFLPWEADANEK